MVTLFEKFNNKYKYDVISILINSEDDSKIFQELCFNNGLVWINGGEHHYLDILRPGTYFDINLKDGSLSRCSIREHAITHFEPRGYKVDPIIYKHEDYRRVESIVKHGGVPSYTPKKFDRTLERSSLVESAAKEYVYDHTGFIVRSTEESHMVQRYLLDQGFNGVSNYDGYREFSSFPQIIWVYPNSKKSSSSSYSTYDGFGGYKDEIAKNYIKRSNENVPNMVNPTIFKASDINNLDKILRFGLLTPSYAPKKFDRTLERSSLVEAFQNKYIYDVISVRVDNSKESELFQQLCFDNDIPWASHTRELLYLDTDFPDYLMISLGDYIGHPCILHGQSIEQNDWTGANVDKKIYTATDYRIVKSILENGTTLYKPSYKPKKFDRTLESVTPYPYRFKTEEEFEKKFGSDWRSIVVHTWDSPGMDCLFGEDYPYYVDKDEESNDELPEVATESEFIDDEGEPYSDGEWTISWDMLTPNKPNVPNYQPKKFDRTLESVSSESIDIEEISIHLTNEADNERVQKDLFQLGYKWNVHGIQWVHPLSDKGEIVITFYPDKAIIWAAGIKEFQSFQESGWRKKLNIFTIDDWNRIKAFIKYGQAPSYTPKKFDRTLESIHRPTKYNFVIFKFENQNDFIKGQKIINNKGFLWKGDQEFLENSYDFPCYLFVQGKRGDDWDNYIFFDSELRLNNGNLFDTLRVRSDARKEEICPDIFTLKDADNVAGLFDYGTIPSYKPKKFDRSLEAIKNKIYLNEATKQFTEWPYRIKTKEEFDAEFSRISRNEWGTPEYLFISEMNYLLGTTLEYDFPDDVENIQIPRKDSPNKYWYITRDMLSKNPIGVPSYNPKKFDRDINENFNIKEYPYRYLPFVVDGVENIEKIVTFFHNKYGLESKNSIEFIVRDVHRVMLRDKYDVLLVDLNLTEYNGHLDNDFGLEKFSNLEHRRSYDDKIDIKTYTINDLWLFDERPNYKPKKFDRTLENFHEKYPYDSIVIAIHNQEEADESKKYIGKFVGYDGIYYDMIEKGYEHGGYYIRINNDNYQTGNYCTYSALYNLEDSNPNYKSYEKLFTVNDLRNGVVDNIFKRGNSIVTPSYEPKKFDRTLESHKYYPYRFKTREEFLKEFGSYWKTTVGWNSEGEMDYLLGMDFPYPYEDLPKVFHLNSQTGVPFKINPPIDDDFWNVRKNMLTKNKPNIPSYQPKKFDRTLESLKPENYKYEGLAIKINDASEIPKVIEYFYNKYEIESFKRLERVIDTITIMYNANNNYIIVLLDDKEFMMVSERLITRYISVFNLNPTIYTADDVKYFNNELQVGPSYKPKNFDRTLESFEDNKCHYRFKTRDEFVKEFGRGWKSKVLWNPEDKMDYLLGTKLQVDFPKHKEEVCIPRKEGDLEFDDDKWYIIRDMLVKEPIIPNYSPKKFDRGIDESIEYYLYKRCVFKIIDEEESKKVQYYLFDKGFSWSSSYTEGYFEWESYPQLIWIYFEGKKLSKSSYNSYSPYSIERVENYIKEDNKNNGEFFINPTIFNAKDIEYLDSIKKTGKMAPSYKPKKFDRDI